MYQSTQNIQHLSHFLKTWSKGLATSFIQNIENKVCSIICNLQSISNSKNHSIFAVEIQRLCFQSKLQKFAKLSLLKN